MDGIEEKESEKKTDRFVLKDIAVPAFIGMGIGVAVSYSAIDAAYDDMLRNFNQASAYALMGAFLVFGLVIANAFADNRRSRCIASAGYAVGGWFVLKDFFFS